MFVPRPETELLVEWGLEWLGGRTGRGWSTCAPGRAPSLPRSRPSTTGHQVFAVERDPARWVVAAATSPAPPVTVDRGDAPDPAVLADLDGTVDLVLCNPPYVPEIGAAGLPPEVTEHDPHVAVFGGTDGLD